MDQGGRLVGQQYGEQAGDHCTTATKRPSQEVNHCTIRVTAFLVGSNTALLVLEPKFLTVSVVSIHFFSPLLLVLTWVHSILWWATSLLSQFSNQSEERSTDCQSPQYQH